MMMQDQPNRQTETIEEALLLREPESQVVLYNDDVNTFDWVIDCLVSICRHDPIQAEQCALLVHYKGKAIVKSGDEEAMKAIVTALCERDLSAALV